MSHGINNRYKILIYYNEIVIHSIWKLKTFGFIILIVT
jgi:hypothetical protein